MTHFDLIIIGSGSGNSVVTDEMADWHIALVEESTFGGTCLNVGCIPTKMYVYAADVASTVRHAARYGVDAHVEGVRWRDIRDRVFGRIDPISAAGRVHRDVSARTTLYESHAEFTSPGSIRLGDGRELSADRIVVATGSRPVVPEMVSATGVPFHTSDTVMRLERLPQRLVIIGGGYVAAEFAHIFSALGTQVTLLARGPRLLRHLDGEISRRFTGIAGQIWDVRLNVQIASLTGTDEIRIALDDGSVADCDTLLVAAGRVPNTDRLALDVAGVDVDEGGLIVVDDFQGTSVDGIWALGDATSARQLKHVANQDARIVAHNLTNPGAPIRSNHDHVPAAVFTEPQLASVGLTEEEARAAGLDYVAAVQPYRATAYGWAMEDTTSVCKLVAERGTGRLLGAHLMGPHASILIQPLIQAMTFGQRVGELAREQYWIHPALTEVVENALLKLDLAPSGLAASPS